MNDKALPSLAVIVALAIVFLYIRPTLNGPIADANSAIDFDNQALAAAAQFQSEESHLAQERDQIDPQNLEKVTAFLPDSVDNVNLVLDLNALAARSGLSLTSIDVSSDSAAAGTGAATPGNSAAALPTSAQSPVGSISLTVDAAGTFGALQTFLQGVERSSRLLDVDDLVVKGSDTGVYTYAMTIRLYWLR